MLCGMVERNDGTDGAKRTLRHEAIARRKRVDPAARTEAGLRLAGLMGELPLPSAVATDGAEPDTGSGTAAVPDGTPSPRPTVAAYVSMGSEIETRPLLDALLRAGYRVLVPMLGTGLDVGWGELDSTGLLRDMDAAVAASSPASVTARGPSAGTAHHRPDEPEGETLPPESLADAALVLVPALAVDRTGTRLGRGGGWYDRALGHRSPDCPVFAVCWDWEVLAEDAEPLPREAHDLPVDGVMTPAGVVRFE